MHDHDGPGGEPTDPTHDTSGQPTSGSDPPPEPGPILTEPNEPGGIFTASLKGKGGELANLTYPTLAGVIDQAHRGIERVRQSPHLPYSFLRRTGLSVSSVS